LPYFLATKQVQAMFQQEACQYFSSMTTGGDSSTTSNIKGFQHTPARPARWAGVPGAPLAYPLLKGESSTHRDPEVPDSL
jgi:hypothetical protein